MCKTQAGIEQSNKVSMVIGISKAEAKRHKVSIVSDTVQEYDEYWFFLSIRRKVHVVRLQPHSYYCISISRYPEENINDSSSYVFGAIQNVSVRAKIQTIRSKATSLIGSHTSDTQEITCIINDIPWLFLKSKTPAQLAVEMGNKND